MGKNFVLKKKVVFRSWGNVKYWAMRPIYFCLYIDRTPTNTKTILWLKENDINTKTNKNECKITTNIQRKKKRNITMLSKKKKNKQTKYL